MAGPRKVDVRTRSASPGPVDSAAPTARVTEVTGMSSANPSPRVPLRSPATSLTMTTADAPAAYAFWALVAKVQAPRSTSTIRPTGKPA